MALDLASIERASIQALVEAAEEITCNLDPVQSGCSGIHSCSTCPLVTLAIAARRVRNQLGEAT